MQGTQMALSSVLGVMAAVKVGPFQTATAKYYPLFRKSWMKLPMRLTAFWGAYYCGNQLQTRLFPRFNLSYYKNGGINENIHMGNQDLIAKFRFFEHEGASADAKSEIERYLDVYTSGPLTKADML